MHLFKLCRNCSFNLFCAVGGNALLLKGYVVRKALQVLSAARHLDELGKRNGYLFTSFLSALEFLSGTKLFHRLSR
jgi:hypothetical protein